MKHTHSLLHVQSAHGLAPPRAGPQAMRPRTPVNPGHLGESSQTTLVHNLFLTHGNCT